jgi:hypothetical protein
VVAGVPVLLRTPEWLGLRGSIALVMMLLLEDRGIGRRRTTTRDEGPTGLVTGPRRGREEAATAS